MNDQELEVFRKMSPAEKRRWLNGLSCEEFSRQLFRHPELADFCPLEKIGIWSWADLLLRRPEFADRCPWDSLPGCSLSYILQKQPQLRNFCDLKKLNVEDWYSLLIEVPSFAPECPCRDEFLDSALFRLACAQPSLLPFAKAETWPGGRWFQLVSANPKAITYVPSGTFDVIDWEELLMSRPELAEYCPEEIKAEMKERRERFIPPGQVERKNSPEDQPEREVKVCWVRS
jgi:hypothetical protein